MRINRLYNPLLAGILHLLRNKSCYSLIIAILILSSGYLRAQEKLQALTQNTQLQTQGKQTAKLKSISAQSLQLPIIDDFSSTSMFPDSKIWADRNVFINNSFAVNPKTIGVATFDVFDSKGKIYDIATGIGFGADTLTSNPINLNYNKESNIRLSFYYQPGGLGDIPDEKDSLTLQFYAPVSRKWLPVWITPGYDTLLSFTYKSILINDTAFLHDGFRFRFINYASLTPSDIAGKTSIPDVWNLDYVKLDKNRAENDSVYEDIAMIKPLSSLLKTYNAMPWSHYLFAFIQEIKPKVEMTYKIYNPQGLTVDRKFTFKELNTNYPTDTLNMGGEINDPWQNIYKDYDLTNPFTSRNKDSAIYEVRSFISIEDTINKYKYNDTAKFTQVFTNYFAYDDGNAESGYGISGQGAENAKAAYRFYSYFPDTLRSIAIFFNPSQNNATDTIYFRLAVWSNNNGKPGELIYRDTWERTPIIKPRNEFAYYALDSGIRVNETFFIGWEQSSEGFLNIGYDLNSSNGQRFLFYNINGTWEQSGSSGNVRPGSLMFRPIMRTRKSSPVPVPVVQEKQGIRIFPNPAIEDLTITKDAEDNDRIIRLTFYNVTGRVVKTVEMPAQTIPITDLKPGLYILKVQTQKGNTQTVKLLKEM
ncbi:MAG TPA: T9SS type A sorting domain-containing protein [Bacteroidales bacterium]|nr:T9SS type A sorting domain-containing protein [Bacteroidales bacterium]